MSQPEFLRIVRHEDEEPTAAGATQPPLEELLGAWKTATDRLEQTHQALREEVRRLTDELEAKNRELARQRRLADLGQMAAHVAHEVRNSLMPMTLYLSLLKRRLDDDPGSLDVVDKVATGLATLEATVDDLLTFTADREPRWQRVPVRPLVQELVDSLAAQLAAQRIRCRLEVPLETKCTADPNMLRRAVFNLILNAVDAMPEGGELVDTAFVGRSGLELEIADSGAGIAPGDWERLFEPFFTTKDHGTGLGLAIVQRIAQAHGGDVHVVNCPEGGAAFTLCLPHRVKERAA